MKFLQPVGWNDITIVYSQFFGHDYFLAYKGSVNGKMISVGELILTENTAWLGNIIVHPEFRKKGFGQKITKFLSDLAHRRNRHCQLLLATDLGTPVYRKMNFQEIGEYSFMKSETPRTFNISENIAPLEGSRLNELLELDRLATGEGRADILSHFLDNAVVYLNPDNDVLEGFFLPKLGDGLIVASNSNSGIALMEFRIQSGRNIITLPSSNKVAIHHAKALGFSEYRKAAFMFKGRLKSWNPDMIYNRVGGYLG